MAWQKVGHRFFPRDHQAFCLKCPTGLLPAGSNAAKSLPAVSFVTHWFT
jgi:hypothetical protein